MAHSEQSAIRDMDGWPIRKNARIHVPRRDSALLGPDWRDSQERRALPSISGIAKRTYTSAKGEACVELVEFDTGCRRDVRAQDCRVMRGETKGSVAWTRDQDAAEAVRPKGRKRTRRSVRRKSQT